ncbi:MAG: hypothetical protein WBP56_23055 [Polyangia bacterium]
MQNIIYSGTVPITRNPTSFVYTIGTNSGQQQFFGRLQRHVPTCSASDLQVTSAN